MFRTMGKRRADADSRRFFDAFESVKASYFRGRDIIDPKKNTAIIPLGGKDRLIGTKHTWFANGGGYSYFVCPGCARRASRLYLIDDAPRCVKCCAAMNIRHRSVWGLGRDERRRCQDEHLNQIIAKLETDKPLKFKPAPKAWRGRLRIMRSSIRLTERMRRNMVQLRLNQLASQQAKANGGLSLTKAYMPRSHALAVIPELKQAWKARTYERLEQALDNAQAAILAALNSDNPTIRINAAKLMMRTKQARERGL
jgi:hypothetical protein